MTSQNSIPNLDTMTRPELMAFHRKYNSVSHADAADLIGDNPRGYCKAVHSLAYYAWTRAALITAQEQGDQNAITRHTEAMDYCRNKLPAFARWTPAAQS